jgi:hypothetical protein
MARPPRERYIYIYIEREKERTHPINRDDQMVQVTLHWDILSLTFPDHTSTYAIVETNPT